MTNEILQLRRRPRTSRFLQTITESSPRWLYRHRRAFSLAIYAGVTALAYLIGYLLRFEFLPPQNMMHVFRTTVLLLVLVRVGVNWTFGLNSSRWRFSGTRDVVRLAVASTVGSAVFFLLTRGWTVFPLVPRSIILIELLLTINATASVWLTYRVVLEQMRRFRSAHDLRAKRVLIVGAGEAGSLLVREMTRVPTGYRPVGIIDDDPTTWRSTVHGYTVYGGTDVLALTAVQLAADEIVIAIPSASPAQLRNIVSACEATNLGFKVLPGIASVINGDVGVNQLRDLRIDDLLGREPVKLELPELYDDLRGRSVLITGAAGSIGSELARQVALHEPGMLVLFDQAETPLFFLERELREKHPELQMLFLIGDIVDPSAVERLFHDFAPSRVFHAAAYKHVPMMQVNPREAIRNNVYGTHLVADAAGRAQVERFVLVSTDKAVRPTSIMGATKRLAEIAIQELQNKYPATTFAAVRFGNVLGSNGSVIEIFKKQIEDGHPLTVTHPEVTRYFMTIPEAVHLILQASLLPDMQGRIVMLEMGEPVRIVDLAKNILRLSGTGFRRSTDIIFTGLRWGEKLHEELTAPDEVATPTAIAKVRLVEPPMLVMKSMLKLVEQWEHAFSEGRDHDVIASVASLFPNIHPRSAQTGTDARYITINV